MSKMQIVPRVIARPSRKDLGSNFKNASVVLAPTAKVLNTFS